MAKLKGSNKTPTSAPVKPGADFYFAKYAAAHQNSSNTLLQYIFIPLLWLGVFGLMWALPFPYFKFLGIYNSYINWASLLITISIYFYLRLSPILSYVMLLIEFALSYVAMLLLQWQRAGGLLLISIIIIALSAQALYIGYKKEGKKLNFEYRYKNLLIAPLYLLHLLFTKLKIKH